MIPRTAPRWQSNDWQIALKNAITDSAELISRLQLNTEQVDVLSQSPFPVRVPEPFIARMQAGDPNDPLLLQVLPLAAENLSVPGYEADPLQEAAANPTPGLIHKYHGRVLLIVSGGCAVNCRYCFRRHFPYEDNSPSQSEWQSTIDYLQADPSISEVILSGGDPLMLPDGPLLALCQRIATVPHIKRLRIHSRLPVVIPQRITQTLLEGLHNNRLTISLVWHINHAQEIDEALQHAANLLTDYGVILLNQTVLLRGINDSVSALSDLSEKLVESRIMPYYLHCLDKVSGAAHFDTPTEKSCELVHSLRNLLPGYMVPLLVREEPGKPSKTPV